LRIVTPALLATIGAGVFFSGYQTSGKTLYKGQPPTLVTAYALLVATGVMFVIAYATNHTLAIQGSVVSFAERELLTGTLLALGNYMIFLALATGPLSKFTIVYVPLLLALNVVASKFINHEPIHPQQVLAATGAIACIIWFIKA
jgi:drug/metabolite transporter (DMT)-like permease